MVATTDETFKPEKNRSRADLWVLAALSGIALVCVSLLAVALALILGKGSLIQVNPVFNSPGTGAGSATAAASAAQPPEAPAVDRGWAAQGLPSALPVAQAVAVVPTAVPTLAQPALALRAEANAPMERVPVPVESVPAPESGAVFQVRGEAPSFYTGDQALPMPVRHIPGYDSAASQTKASSVPRGVAASLPAPTALATPPPAAPVAAAAVPPSGGPGVYAKVSSQGALVNLRLEAARSAASLPGFSASQGNLFFTARVLIHNKGAAPLAVDSDAFDLRDADGDSYMAMPGTAAMTLAAGSRNEMAVTFLIPDDAALRSLALVLPSEKDLLPLSQP